MNEKKSLQDLYGKISEDAGVSKKTTDSFLRSLFEVIEEALKRDGIVKIPEFGTFKLVQVEQRKSVNVRTQEEIVIPAYQKVTFTPTKEVKDKVNQPFAHLLTYTIRQDGPVDPPEPDDDNEEVEESFSDFSNENETSEFVETVEPEPLAEPVVSETVTEEPQATAEPIVEAELVENQSSTVEVESQTESSNEVINTESEIESSAEVVEENVDEKSEKETNNTETSENNTIDKTIDNENEKSMELNDDKKEFESQESAEIQNDSQQAAQVEESHEETTEKSEEKEVAKSDESKKPQEPKKNKNWLLWLILLLIVVLAVLFGVKYAMDNHLFGLGGETEQVEATQPAETKEVDTFFDENATDEAEQPATAATEDDEFEEQQEPIDCYETPEKCTTDIQPLESGEKTPLNTHEFDPDLVKFMNEKHPELNFQSTVVVRETYTVKEGSRLAQISRNLYGDAFNFWVYIYYFNTDVLAKPDAVKAGMKLKVPDLGSDYVDPTSQKCKKLANEVAEHLLNQK